MDFSPAGTPSSQQPSQNSFHTEIASHFNNSTTSSSSTLSQDKKPRAKPSIQSGTALSIDDRYDCSQGSKVGTNPFLASTLHERDENFPSFDEAFLNASGDSNHELPRNSDIGSTNATNLSISALAALAEHNRHVSRYGIDNSFLKDQDDDDATFPQSLFADPLDVEWERLLLNTSHNSAVNVSHISLNHSLQSVPEHVLCDEKIQVTTSRSPDGAENEAIEVMTEVSYSDFLNTSRMINVLRTPEHMKRQEREDIYSSDNDGVTTRPHKDFQASSNQTSEASFSDDSTRKLQKLYYSAMLPPITQERQLNDSSSMISTPSLSNKSGDNGNIVATASFSLHNVDLSRISADDDDDSAIIRNLDHSFGTNSANDNSNILPNLIDRLDVGIHLNNDQTPSTSNSKSRKTMTKHQYGDFPESSSIQKEYNWWHDSSKKSNPFSNTNNSTIVSPARSPKNRLEEQSRDVTGIPNNDNGTESKLDMMALSPISRQAADTAISLLRSSPDWNRTKAKSERHDDRLSHPNPFRAEALPEFFNDTNGTNDTSSESRVRGSDRSTGTQNVVEYEHQSISTSSDNQLHTTNEDGISPLNSSSEPNNNTDSSNSGIVPINTETADQGSSNIFENSGSSDDHLKKNSLSSISPNSSSEHHITTKPTTTTNSVSSYSVTSSNSKQDPSLLPPTVNPIATSQSGQLPQSSKGANMHSALPIWDDQNDRRRYRTVVPIRVFINEPYHFPNEDDSFTSLRRKSSFLSLPSISRSRIGIQNHDRSERSVRSDPR